MPTACALGIIGGKNIFNFEIAERLRTLRYLIFTEGVCTFSHKKRAYGRGKAVHCAKKWVCLLQNGGKRAIL